MRLAIRLSTDLGAALAIAQVGGAMTFPLVARDRWTPDLKIGYQRPRFGRSRFKTAPKKGRAKQIAAYKAQRAANRLRRKLEARRG